MQVEVAGWDDSEVAATLLDGHPGPDMPSRPRGRLCVAASDR